MLFQKKTVKSPYPSIRLQSEDNVLYEGSLTNLPFREDVILQKSVAFFQDPEPCFIHRNAVRVRLIEDLFRELSGVPKDSVGPLMKAYADFDGITSCTVMDSE